ncbi:type III-A CRISPR-associated RAMP protein Csm5 [Bacteroidia bacterium]|nr:type III-A CRISPR-associated RAMP protein Csm5 [Bacteroidia bacterium]
MRTSLGYKYNLKIETITPVAIGSGETLSPLADYWIYGNTACLLNHQKLEKALEAKPEYLSEYINRINGNVKSDKNNFLDQFIKCKLKGNLSDFISQKITIKGTGNAKELKTCIQENGKLFIPGSTIKGAVKSAMLYNWLMREEQETPMTELLKELKDLYKYKALIKDNEKRVIDRINSLLANFLEKPSKEQRLNFSLLQITDTYFEKEVPEWIHTCRYPLKNKKKKRKGIPVFLEAIPSKSYSSLCIQFEENKVAKNTSECLKPYFNANGMTTLFAQINRYSVDNLKYEQACVEQKDTLKGYLNELDSLQTQITQSTNDIAFLPLGFGKANFYQSIGLALYNWLNIVEKESTILDFAFKNYLRLFKLGQVKQEQLPTTRLLIQENQQPLGWVKLTIK